MSMRINIENILYSPQELFLEIVEKLTKPSICNANFELQYDNSDIDIVLIDAIKMILYDLNNEEGYISRLLYSIFGFEIRKNKRREQLIILGSQLKSQYISLKKDIHKVETVIGEISSSDVNIKRLKKAFEAKQMFILEKDILDKCKSYISILTQKLLTLDGYKNMLTDKLHHLRQKDKIYKSTFRKIPRYNEISPETYLQLTR